MKTVLGFFIAGSSHTGKSSLAQRLHGILGWEVISTDDLGRHPGRPWPDVRPQVAEFYRGLCPRTLHWFLKIHHENMWPCLLQVIERHEKSSRPFILEGAALRPDSVATLDLTRYKMLFLHAPNSVLRARIEAASRYHALTAERRHLVDSFIERSLLENEALHAGFAAIGIAPADAQDLPLLEDLSETVDRNVHH